MLQGKTILITGGAGLVGSTIADQLVGLVLVGVVGTFGLNFQITLALVDKVVFHRGAASFGLLTSLLAAIGLTTRS